MPRRSRSSIYSSYYSSSSGSRDGARRIPNPLPYLLIALLAGAGLVYFHYFAYKSIGGKVTNAYTREPMAGVTVMVQSATAPAVGAEKVTSAASITTTTSADGTFSFAKTPQAPVVLVSVDGYTPERVDVSGKSSVDIALVPNRLSGKVLGPDGKGIAKARIFAGPASTVAGPDGSYQIKDLPADRKLVVKAGGYLAKSVQFGKVGALDITLDPFTAKAIYISADSVATPGKLQALIDLLDRTELNAAVIDVKADNSGVVLYSSKLQIVKELDTARAIIPDLPGLLEKLKAKKIYTIARLSVFWDQAATTARPEWALKSKKAPGQVWVDSYSKRWANPFLPAVWDYNIAIAQEVAALGFNEVQFDNVQFPSEGDLGDIDFGPEAADKKRTDAVNSFLDRAYTVLSPAGTYVAVDVFGLTAYVSDDMGVGQNYESVAQRADYISPSIYPSLFADGFNNYAKPAEKPFEVVSETVKAANGRLGPSSVARLRPWLQDFSGKVTYDTPKVRAEIDAAEQNGTVGWMLWNFTNTYTEPALKPQ